MANALPKGYCCIVVTLIRFAKGTSPLLVIHPYKYRSKEH